MMRRRTRAWMGVAAAGLSLLLAAACGSSSNNNAKDAGAATPCKNSLDCVHAPGGLGICNTAAGVCVQCVAATDCPADNDCVDNACVPYTPCSTSLDCPTSQVCNASRGRCVACNGDNDCTGGKHCIGNVCRAPCSSDKDCTPLGLLCNTSLGVCVQCTSAADCGAGETCNAGNCVAGGVGGAGGSGAGGTSGNGGGGSTGVGGNGGTAGAGGGPPACVRYVDLGAASGGNGTSWTKAFRDVQSGINAAAAAGAPCEVWVAQGTYYVYKGAAADSIALHDGVDVYGGFAGNETTRAARDWKTHVTVLDGHASAGSASRVAHVVTADAKAILDGFKITGGNAPAYGAGIVTDKAVSPTIENCTVTGNTSGNTGGGARFAGGSPLIQDCTFSSNHAAQSGGAIQMSGGTIMRCVFSGNSSGNDAGGVGISGGAPIVENSIFYGNTAADFAGGLAVGPGTGAARIVNNTFYNNQGVHGGGGFSVNTSTSVSANNIAFANSGQYGPNILRFTGVTADIHQNCGDGGMDGTNNVSADPQLIDPAGGNFRLAASSPCIDRADDSLAPPEDYAHSARYDVPGVGTSIADMGAFEYHP